MVRIYRYLATASAIVLLLAFGAVAWFYNQQAVRDLVETTTKHNIGVATILMNTIWSRYGDYLVTAGDLDRAALLGGPETEEIQKLIQGLTEDVQVLKVKIYSTNGTTIFSGDPAQIGQDYSNNVAFLTAVREGRPSSELAFADHVTVFSGESFHRDVVETYLPMFDDGGKIAGVFEVYSDVTDVRDRIDQTTINMLVGLVAIFGALYGVLVFGIMRRAVAPIRLASSHAAKISPWSSGVRLPIKGMPRELLPLLTAVNSALDRLDRALDAERRFATDSAHELLTPLAVLRAHLDTLDDTSVATALRQDVDAMTDVVHQLLDLAELESRGEVTTEGDPTDLRRLCVDVVGMLAPLAVRDGKLLALAGSEEPVLVRGCVRMLRRALRNLIENALSHTPPGTTVEIHLSDDGAVRVTDCGAGVPPDQRDVIFQRFWHGDGSVGSGAGLGLSIVKRIVDSAGGSVSVDDAPGGGASFTIRLVTVGTASPNRPTSGAEVS